MKQPERGQVVNLPIVFGDGRSRTDFDWITRLPENMLAIARQIKGGNGYMRMMPGLRKSLDVAGISRGVHWNTVSNTAYRVMGGKLYNNGNPIADISAEDRTPMAHSRTSQGIVSQNQLILIGYDGTRKTFANWPRDSGTDVDNPQYTWGDINDVCHLRQRYIFSVKGSDTFWISDLTDESHPDKTAPAYRAESMPDGIVAIRAWRDYVLCFGTASIEFFGLTGDDQNVYASQPSYTVEAGTLGRETVAQYLNSFAFITSPFVGEYTIALMNPGGGDWSDLASIQIKKILSAYSVAQLQDARLEAVSFESHKLLIVHLPDQTLVYDHPVSQAQGVPVWSIIKTGVQNASGPHRAIDYCNEGSKITVGDKREAILGEFDMTTCSQYGADQEIVLYTPLMPFENMILSDFEIDASVGGDSVTSRMWLSATEDGSAFGQEILIDYNTPQQWLKRVILKKIGRCRTALAFKIRTVGATPATLSRARVRVS
ncbi:head closure Hc3 [Escherichia phage Sortsne]|uniref:DNA stabilization protein n=1 Tax=Escherichia phage Sortsne TaxID=2562456 RepID=A0A4D6DZ64_9CAUD|nr:head closure Hc3 [Escherichia phage Sortsne]QBZ71602.1 DNA stabilization protein [Escherichia phage Sortsne]